MRQILLFIIVLTFSSLGFAALPRHFSTGIAEDKWQFEGNPLTCELKQAIPYLGEVKFIHQHVKAEKMEMHTWQQHLEGSFTQLFVFQPTWKTNNLKETLLSKIPMRAGRKSITLNETLTQSALAYLAEGYTMRFKFKSHIGNPITVDIGSSHFQKPYQSFAECQRNLLDFTLDDIKKTTIYFPVNGTRLSKSDIDHIMRIQKYLMADPRVSKVVIRGFSDGQGRRGHNNYLSELRAKAVYKYLMMGNKISKQKIKLNWYGEKYPISTNDTEIGQALNRRVTIELYVDYP